MVTPEFRATQVLKSAGNPPVPATQLLSIAESEDIKVRKDCFPEDQNFDGILFYKGLRKGILINTAKDLPARHNFTLAHELGHYFLDHKPESAADYIFQCSKKDYNNPQSLIEVEANRFAVELLMPESLFRTMMLGAPLDFSLIRNMAVYFQVSKAAVTYRLLDFVRERYIVIFSDGAQKTIPPKASMAAKNIIGNLKMPVDKLEYQENFVECEPTKWFIKFRESMKLYECTHISRKGNFATTIIKIE